MFQVDNIIRNAQNVAARVPNARLGVQKEFSKTHATSYLGHFQEVHSHEPRTMHLHLATALGIWALVGCGFSQKHNTTGPQLPRNSSSVLTPLYQPYSNSTPVFENAALLLTPAFSEKLGAPANLLKRQSDGDLPVGTCAPGTPCTNGACCSNTGICSYAPTSCGSDVCISNCDAKAPCGQYADPANASCPLNVCCSQYGFCKSSKQPTHIVWPMSAAPISQASKLMASAP